MAYSLTDIERILAILRRRLRILEIQGSGSIIKTGVAIDRPTAVTLSPNTTTMYYATDTKTLSIWNIETESWDDQIFT